MEGGCLFCSGHTTFCISFLQSGRESAEEDPAGEGQGNLGGPGLAVSALVWYGGSQQEKAAEVPKENKQSHPMGGPDNLEFMSSCQSVA